MPASPPLPPSAMASGFSRAHVNQFFPAKKRRPSSRKDEPPSEAQHGSPGGAKGSLAGYLVRSPSATAAVASTDPAGSPRGGDAGARRSLSAEMDVDIAYSAAAAAGDGGDLELKRFTMEFLSHYCSAIPSVMDDAGKGEPDKKQKRSASKSFLVPCGNGSVKKQCVAHCGGLEALKFEELGDNVPFKKQCVTDYGGSETLEELGEGAKVSSEGFLALQRRSFTPNTAQKKVGFSRASGETPKSASSLISPGEEFWNAAIEFADGISALADKGPRRSECDAAEDKSSCAVALCSKTLPRSGNGHFDCENTVGSNDTKQMDKFSNKVESVAANSQHKNSSPLPVKHLDFFHVDEIQVSALKDKEKGGTIPGSEHVDQGQLKDGSFHRRENLIHSVDDIKKNTLDLHADSSAMIPGEELLKSTAAGKGHSTGVCDTGSRMIKRDINQLTHGEDKSFAAYSNCGKPNKD